MPFARPSLVTLARRAVSDLESRLGISAVRLRTTTENVLARVLAGISHGLHGHLAWLAEQVIWDRAEGTYLRRWAGIFGLAPFPAQPATGQITVTGTNGTVIPAGTQWSREDGTLYRSTAEATIAGGSVAVSVEAVEAGAAGDVDAGVELTITAPIAGADSIATVSGANMDDGSDEETDAELRGRLLQRLDQPPAGGGEGDYVRWARSIPGVSRAWARGGAPKLGWVTVFFVRDAEDPITPSPAEIEEVEDVVLAAAPLHMTDKIVVSAPAIQALSVEVQISPDTAEIRASVVERLVDLVLEKAEPGPAGGGLFYVAWLQRAIGRAAGLDYHVLVSPAADVVVAAGALPTISVATITFS